MARITIASIISIKVNPRSRPMGKEQVPAGSWGTGENGQELVSLGSDRGKKARSSGKAPVSAGSEQAGEMTPGDWEGEHGKEARLGAPGGWEGEIVAGVIV
ncbi:MAG: hypothetical protein ABJB49_01965 [Nitrospirota bacterium]